MNELVIESSGKVFADLGFDPGEATVLKMRADLLNALRVYLENSRWRQESGYNSRRRAWPTCFVESGRNSAWNCSLPLPPAPDVR